MAEVAQSEAEREREAAERRSYSSNILAADLSLTAGEIREARRRLENRLFGRDAVEHSERTLFPPIMTATLAPDVAAGRTELVDLGHRMMMNLAASTAGVDRPLGTADETRHLYDYLLRFIEGATLAHYTGDRTAKADEVRTKLEEFDADDSDREPLPLPRGKVVEEDSDRVEDRVDH